jgi:hypothetical protein
MSSELVSDVLGAEVVGALSTTNPGNRLKAATNSQTRDSSAELAIEALRRASPRASPPFAPPLFPGGSPQIDVAQRLIDLELSGAADELTWTSYDR